MRLQQFVASDTPAPVSAVTDLRKQKRADLFAQIDARLARRGNAHELATRLERAGLSLTLSEFTLLRAGAAVLVTLVLLALAPQLWWVVLLPGVIGGSFLPVVY